MRIDKIRADIFSSKTPAAIIIGLESMQGLQSARILNSHNIPVMAIAKDAGHSNCKSRSVERLYIWNGADEGLIALLEKIGSQFETRPVLFPCEDHSVLLISRNREKLDRIFRYSLPAPEVVELLMDKVTFYAYAKENGYPIPATYFLKNIMEAEEVGHELNFPCIMKPASRTPEWEKQTTLKAFKVFNRDEYLHTYKTYHQWTDVFVVQEFIAGDDKNLYSCNCYFDENSQPLASFIARKLRQWPPRTGQSCLGEEVREDTVLNESLRLFRALKFQGLGYVEMKKDSRNGKYYFVEPNIGRPTGRSAIAEAGGVELLYTMYCHCTGKPLPQERRQKYTGVKWIHLRRDLLSAYFYWKEGELGFKEWWKSLQGKKAYAVFSWKDPLPFLWDIFRFIRLGISSNERRKRDHRLPVAENLVEEKT